MDWYHPLLGLLNSSQSFTLNDIQYPSDWLRHADQSTRTDLGFLHVRQEARPDDRLFFVSEQIVTVDGDTAVVSWNSTPRDPTDIARSEALATIDLLERSITDRMWREDAKGSKVLMDFGPDDARTGKTATQYIKYVDDQIALSRALL